MDEDDIVAQMYDATRLTQSPAGVGGQAHAQRKGGAQARDTRGRFGNLLAAGYKDALQAAGEIIRQAALQNYDSYHFGSYATSSGYPTGAIREAVAASEVIIDTSTKNLSVTVGIGNRGEDRPERPNEAHTPTIGQVAQWLFGGHQVATIEPVMRPALGLMLTGGFHLAKSVRASGPHPVFALNADQQQQVNAALSSALAPKVADAVKQSLTE